MRSVPSHDMAALAAASLGTYDRVLGARSARQPGRAAVLAATPPQRSAGGVVRGPCLRHDDQAPEHDDDNRVDTTAAQRLHERGVLGGDEPGRVGQRDEGVLRCSDRLEPANTCGVRPFSRPETSTPPARRYASRTDRPKAADSRCA